MGAPSENNGGLYDAPSQINAWPSGGVSLLSWGAASFEQLASNTAGAAAPAALTVARTGAELGRVLDRPFFVALASAPTGPGLQDARVVASRLEVIVRYREP